MCDGNKDCKECTKCNKTVKSNYRKDSFRVTNFKETSTGCLIISGIVTRSGVFKYEDGNELRDFKEVFKKDSLDSIFTIPVTWEHPPDLLTTETIKDYQKGFVASPAKHVKIDNKLGGEVDAVKVDSIVISDPALIHEIKNNNISEFSLGYHCDLEEVVGTMDGEDYVRKQSNIIYNHLAVVYDARCGEVCSIVEKGDSMRINKKDTSGKVHLDMSSEEKEKAFSEGEDVEKKKEKEAKEEKNDISEEAAYEEGKDVEKREKDDKKDSEEEVPKWAMKLIEAVEKLSGNLGKKDSYSEEEEKEFVEGEDVEKKKDKKKDSLDYNDEYFRNKDSLNKFSFYNTKYVKNDSSSDKVEKSYSRDSYLKQKMGNKI